MISEEAINMQREEAIEIHRNAITYGLFLDNGREYHINGIIPAWCDFNKWIGDPDERMNCPVYIDRNNNLKPFMFVQLVMPILLQNNQQFCIIAMYNRPGLVLNIISDGIYWHPVRCTYSYLKIPPLDDTTWRDRVRPLVLDTSVYYYGLAINTSVREKIRDKIVSLFV